MNSLTKKTIDFLLDATIVLGGSALAYKAGDRDLSEKANHVTIESHSRYDEGAPSRRYTPGISKEGIEMIKEFEGFRDEAYRCAAGRLTIGYGHTKDVKEGDIVSADAAEEMLRKEVRWAENAVRKYVKANITDSQEDALVSFVYNVGENAFRNSTLLRKLNSGDYQGSAEEFMKWNKAGGRVLRGLSARRGRERELFFRGGK